MDAYAVSPGHTLIITPRHAAIPFELTSEELAEITKLIASARQRLDRTLRPSGYNLGINIGVDAGQTVMHVHVHIIPRYPNDSIDPTGGVRNVIAGRSRYRRVRLVSLRGTHSRRSRPSRSASGGTSGPSSAATPKACRQADDLLFRAGNAEAVDEACRRSAVGKLLPNALYVHRDALESLDPLLRVYEGCARAYLGEVEGANLIKLHRHSGKVSYLVYPDFDADPHPALLRSIKLSLRTRELDCHDYAKRPTPPSSTARRPSSPPATLAGADSSILARTSSV